MIDLYLWIGLYIATYAYFMEDTKTIFDGCFEEMPPSLVLNCVMIFWPFYILWRNDDRQIH